jgi:hypothetical protein
MGVDVALYKTLAFGVSAGITGVAGGLGAIAVQFVAPDGYTITLAISLFLGMVVGGVGWLPGSIVGSAFIIFVPNIAEGISKGLSGAVFGVLLFLVIFLVPHGARQVAMVAQHMLGKTQEELRTKNKSETHVRKTTDCPPSGRRRCNFRSSLPAALRAEEIRYRSRRYRNQDRHTSCPTAVPPPPMASWQERRAYFR